MFSSSLIPFFVFLASIFLMYALYLFSSRASEAKRQLLKERLADAIRSSAHSTDIDVQLAREELMSEIPWLNRVLLKLQITAKLKQIIDQADSHISVMQLILFSTAAIGKWPPPWPSIAP
jgi:tight adherence protein B